MSSSRTAWVAAVFGLVAVAAIPVAVAAAAFTSRVTLLHAVYVGVGIACAAGLVAIAVYRRARARFERSVNRSGERFLRLSRLVVFAGVYLAVTGALALGFYGLLHLRA